METHDQETQEVQKNYPKDIAKGLLKIILGLVILGMLLVGGLAIALRFPTVQTRVAQKAASILSKTINHQVSIARVDIKFFKTVVLDSVRVLDRQNKTLFFIGQTEADIGFFKLFDTDKWRIPVSENKVLAIPIIRFTANRLDINTLTLTNPEANLIQYKGTDSLNLSTFIQSISNLITTDTAQDKQPFKFKIDALVLKNGHFTYHDYNLPFKEYGLDYNHMDLERINGRFSSINILGDTIHTQITGLTAQDKKSKTFLKRLDTKMVYAPTFWEWGDLNLRVNDSHLAKFVRFDYNRFANFVDFNDSVHVTANFDSTYVTSDDISMFNEALKGVDEKILLSGKAKGKVNNFRAQNIDLKYGQYTHIKGDISARGLPDFRNTFAELELESSTINARDLKRYIPAHAYPISSRAGTIKLEGAFIGFYNDFVANGKFETPLGNLVSDINLKFDKENANHSSYKGYIQTAGFDLGGLLGDRSVVKTVSMAGRVRGSGFTLQTAKLHVDASINSIHLYDYRYRNIVVDADLSRETFSGDFKIQDPNLSMNATGVINLQNNQQIFDLKADLRRADLRTLGLTNKSIILQTQADVDFTGIKLDDIAGLAKFKNTKLLYDGNEVTVDSLTIESHFHDGIRELHVGSEILALRAGGNFKYTTFFNDLQTLYEEYRLNLQNNPLAIDNYYRRKPLMPPSAYEIDLEVHLRQINPVLQVFAPSVSISDFTRLEGTFRNGPTTILSLVGLVDTVKVGENQFYQNRVELTSSKLWNSPDVLANAVVTSERQKLSGAGDTENLYVEGVWNERLINFSSNIAQTGTTNRANISGNVAFEEDNIRVVFNRSNINVLEKLWTISPNNAIVFADGSARFENVTFSNGPQSVNLFGELSRNPNEQLTINLSNFTLDNLNPLLTTKINGNLNGEVQIKDVYTEVHFSTNLAVDSLLIDNIYIGNVAGTTTWENARNHMNVDLAISRNNQKVLNLTGAFNPNGGNQELDLLAVMDGAQLKLVEPLLNTIMSDMGGTMDGRVRISGKLSAPILKGSVMVTDGSFVFNYLKTKYFFADRVFFTENDISFRDIRLRDIYNNTAILNGGVFHNGFNNIVLDLKARFNRLMVLNTTRNDNPLYYGTAFATGDITALGAVSNLEVKINAKSESGTSIFIPLDNTTSLERQNFITFNSENPAVIDTVKTVAQVVQKSVDLSGINLDFNLEVDENAYLELIFDERTGDIIRGRGRGNIRMIIDTRGEFAMYGTYEIVQGRYNFTMLGIINKEFNVRPGGTVTWNGDPLEGNLRVTATYTQRVSLAPILGNAATTEQERRNAAQIRYPVTAVMDLDGPLTTPQIRLNLEFNDTPNLLEDRLSSYLNRIRNDEQELNRQVFSLLAFKRLTSEAEFQVGLVGDLGSSVGELFSNQLSYWLSQIDNNLEVDIGVSGYGDQAFNDVQLRLSYTFLEGRLRITREGSVNNTQYGPNGRTNTIGDLSAEYYISKNGQLRLRITHQTTARDFANSITTSRQTVSVLHQANFDSFKELFRRRRLSKKARQAQQTQTPVLSDDERTPVLPIKKE